MLLLSSKIKLIKEALIINGLPKFLRSHLQQQLFRRRTQLRIFIISFAQSTGNGNINRARVQFHVLAFVVGNAAERHPQHRTINQSCASGKNNRAAIFGLNHPFHLSNQLLKCKIKFVQVRRMDFQTN